MAYVLALELSAEEEKQVEENENEDKMKRTMRATELLLHGESYHVKYIHYKKKILNENILFLCFSELIGTFF